MSDRLRDNFNIIINRLPTELDFSFIVLRHCLKADQEHKCTSRQFAHMNHYSNTICYAGVLLGMSNAVQLGILAHEVGHLIQETLNLPFDEMGADKLVKQYADIDIIYKNTIQHVFIL